MGDFKVLIDNQGIIRLILQGVHDKEDAETLIEEINKLLKERSKARVLVDLTEMQESTFSSRRAYIDSLKSGQMIFEKFAFFGVNSMDKVFAKFIMKISGEENKVRYFESEAKALKWLKE